RPPPRRCPTPWRGWWPCRARRGPFPGGPPPGKRAGTPAAPLASTPNPGGGTPPGRPPSPPRQTPAPPPPRPSPPPAPGPHPRRRPAIAGHRVDQSSHAHMVRPGHQHAHRQNAGIVEHEHTLPALPQPLGQLLAPCRMDAADNPVTVLAQPPTLPLLLPD